MDPLNKKERTEAFIKMLLLFLLAVSIVAIPMFYAFRMPALDKAHNSEAYENLKNRLEEIIENDRQFLFLTDSARTLFLDYSKEVSSVRKGRISDRFSEILNNMEDLALRVEEDTVRSDLYAHMIDAYSELFVKTDHIAEMKEDFKEEVEEVKEDAQLTPDEQMIELITITLEKHRGNKREAARELGMTRRRLIKKMEELGM